MKNFLIYFILTFFVLGADISEGAELIEVVTLKASSHANIYYNKTHLVDGSGLDPTGRHDGNYEHMWLSSQFDQPTLTFDLGNIYSVDKMDIWQYNYDRFDLLNRGIHDFNIFKSMDGNAFSLVKQASLSRSPGGYIEAQTIALNCQARFIKFEMVSNHGGDSTGLSEVQFWGTPVSPNRSPDIYGYEANNVFVYQGFENGMPVTQETEVLPSRFPQATYDLVSRLNGGPAETEHYETWPNLKYWGFEDDARNQQMKFSSGLIVAWYPMVVGEEKNSLATYRYDEYTFNVSMDVEVLTEETLSLSFGELRAFKLRYAFNVWGYGADEQTEFYQWVVPYLGVVKYQDQESQYALSDFSIFGGVIDTFTDADGDGLKDYLELMTYGTNWQKTDTDDDGMPDGWEAAHGLNLLANDAGEDLDGDRFTNLTECRRGTDPRDPTSCPSKAMPWLHLLMGN
jgi:hypothetical protein